MKFLPHNTMHVRTEAPGTIATDPIRWLPFCREHWTKMASVHHWPARHVQPDTLPPQSGQDR